MENFKYYGTAGLLIVGVLFIIYCLLFYPAYAGFIGLGILMAVVFMYLWAQASGRDEGEHWDGFNNKE